MLGALDATANVITPNSVPLFVTPVLYKSDCPIDCAVLIQNGWETAFTLIVYVIPLTKVNVGFRFVISPLRI